MRAIAEVTTMRTVALLLAVGCSIDQGGPLTLDAPPAFDGPSSCFSSPSYEPAEPVAGPGNMVRANANATGLMGFVTYHWNVQFAGSAVPTTPASPDGRDVTFPVNQAGPYDIVLTIQGGNCLPFVGAVNATASGATQRAWKLVVTPTDGALAPPQARTILVSGGADFDVGSIVVDAGQRISGALTIDGQPASGYLRIAPVVHPEVAAETFANSGTYTVRALAVPSEVFVIPASQAAPARLSGWNIGNANVALTEGTVVSGTVTTAGEGGMAGATVVLRIDGLPSAIGTSGADGSFSLRARPGTTVDVIVTPPVSSGRPRLTATLASPNLAAPLAITFSAATRRSLGGVSIVAGGQPAASARVRAFGNVNAAGSIAFGGQSANAVGTFGVELRADASGRLPAILAPAAPLTVAIVPASPSSPGGAIAINLTNAVPAEIAVPAPQALTTRVLDVSGSPISGARVIAHPTVAEGLLPILSGQTASDGRLVISTAPSVTYRLLVLDPSLRHASAEAGPFGAGALAPITLGRAIRIRGRLSQQDVPIPFASIAAYCNECPADQRLRPVFEGATDAAGRFSLAIPDPGVGP